MQIVFRSLPLVPLEENPPQPPVASADLDADQHHGSEDSKSPQSAVFPASASQQIALSPNQQLCAPSETSSQRHIISGSSQQNSTGL